MKIFKKISLVMTAAAVVATMALPVVAEESVPICKVSPAAVKMQKVELTEEQKAEIIENAKAALDEKLASGEITQEQYDEILAKLESGDMRGFGGMHGPGHHGKGHDMGRHGGPCADETADGETV